MVKPTMKSLTDINVIHAWADRVGLFADGYAIYPLGKFWYGEDGCSVRLEYVEEKDFMKTVTNAVLEYGKKLGRNDVRRRFHDLLEME